MWCLNSQPRDQNSCASLTEPARRPSTTALLTFWLDHYQLWGEESCPVHCRMFSSISSLYPLFARSTSHTHIVTNKNISQHWQMAPVGHYCPQLRTTNKGFLAEPQVRVPLVKSPSRQQPAHRQLHFWITKWTLDSFIYCLLLISQPGHPIANSKPTCPNLVYYFSP